jgi:hypothetical protein
MCRILLEALPAALAAAGGFEVALFVDTDQPRRRDSLRRRAIDAVKRAGDLDGYLCHDGPEIPRANALLRRAGIPVFRPPGGDVNAPAAVARMAAIRPAFALSLCATQIFRVDLLAAAGRMVNYHNGRLPDYRGCRATAWSIYHGEAESGYTWHEVVREIDAGPILASGAVRAPREARPVALDVAKTRLAARDLAGILAALRRGEAGVPPGPGGRYYRMRDVRSIQTVPEPWLLRFEELVLRLRCFGMLRLRAGDREWPVTSLVRLPGPAAGFLVFTSADGVTFRARRLAYLPPPLYRLAFPRGARGNAR